MLHTLLLNADYKPISILPLSIVSWQHAIKLYFLSRVEILETYPNELIRSEHLIMETPSVCITKEYFNYKKTVKFSKSNIFLRDLYTCAYCNETFDRKELTLDHVIPRAAGGLTTWENSVTACRYCNSKKGHKLQKPLRAPFKPDYYSLVNQWKLQPFTVHHKSWIKYLGIN
jgi:5-methylcytosine-specific restriction endonuclease McrA